MSFMFEDKDGKAYRGNLALVRSMAKEGISNVTAEAKVLGRTREGYS